MKSLVLYSTDHCALCEEALDLLFSMPELRGLALQVVDVAEDDALLRRYGERIPVLRMDGREVDAPIDQAKVMRLINPR